MEERLELSIQRATLPTYVRTSNGARWIDEELSPGGCCGSTLKARRSQNLAPSVGRWIDMWVCVYADETHAMAESTYLPTYLDHG